MRKLFFLLAISAGCLQTLSAQEINDFIENKTTFGIKGGLQQDYLNPSARINFSELVAYAGFFTEVRLGRRFSLQNEVFYSTNRRNSISTPVLLKYYFNKKWSIMAGPRFDMATNNSFRATHTSPFAISLDLGAQYNINKRLFIEARYSRGLTNSRNIIYPNPNLTNSTPYYDTVWRNSVTFGMGYKF